jgi:hypothetical protein
MSKKPSKPVLKPKIPEGFCKLKYPDVIVATDLAWDVAKRCWSPVPAKMVRRIAANCTILRVAPAPPASTPAPTPAVPFVGHPVNYENPYVSLQASTIHPKSTAELAKEAEERQQKMQEAVSSHTTVRCLAGSSQQIYAGALGERPLPCGGTLRAEVMTFKEFEDTIRQSLLSDACNDFGCIPPGLSIAERALFRHYLYGMSDEQRQELHSSGGLAAIRAVVLNTVRKVLDLDAAGRAKPAAKPKARPRKKKDVSARTTARSSKPVL